MTVAVARQDEEEVLADKRDLTRAECLAVAVQGQRDDILRRECRPVGVGRRDVIRKETGVAGVRLLVASVLDGRGLEHDPEGVGRLVDCQALETC